MTLAKYRQIYSKPLTKATLCLLVKENQILLAMKKRGFGIGKLNGVGGKVNKGEEILEAVIRETQEEIGVTPISFRKVAILNFYFTYRESFNQQVFVYLVDTWQGIPTETEEMKPQWFSKDKIPFAKMWEDDQYWLPQVLRGAIISGDFLFTDGDKILEKKIIES